MRKFLKRIVKKIKNRTNRKNYKKLPGNQPVKVQNLHIYGTDFGIIEVEAFAQYTENNFQ